MNLIYWEKLFWTIDWINKVFTSQNTIDTVVALNIGWAPYVTFIVSWRTITLATAPTNPSDLLILDYYFLENVPTVTNSNYLVSDSLQDCLDIIWIKQYNNTFSQSKLLRLISEWYFTLINKNRLAKIRGRYSFTKGTYYSVKNQYRGDLIPINTTFDNFTPRVGKVMIGWFITDFITRTDTNVTLSDWLTHSVSSWDLITFWYKIPSSAVDINFITVDWVPFKKLDQLQFFGWEIDNSYTVVDWYLFISKCESSSVVVEYTIRNQLLTLTTDLIEVEPAYQRVFSLYASYKLLYRAEDSRASAVEKEYRDLKREYIAYLKRHSKGANSNNNFNWPLNWL